MIQRSFQHCRQALQALQTLSQHSSLVYRSMQRLRKLTRNANGWAGVRRRWQHICRMRTPQGCKRIMTHATVAATVVWRPPRDAVLIPPTVCDGALLRQCALLKIALLLGVDVRVACSFSSASAAYSADMRAYVRPPYYCLSLSLAVASIISYWRLRLLLAIGGCVYY